MSKKHSEAPIHKFDTVPPPEGSGGAGGAYSAPTKVGAVTSELVGEIMHAARLRAEEQLAQAQLTQKSTADTAVHARFKDAVPEPVHDNPADRVDIVEVASVVPEPIPTMQPVHAESGVRRRGSRFRVSLALAALLVSALLYYVLVTRGLRLR